MTKAVCNLKYKCSVDKKRQIQQFVTSIEHSRGCLHMKYEFLFFLEKLLELNNCILLIIRGRRWVLKFRFFA